jgi:two-component system phosphate regulon response regulator PhoB
VVDDELSTNILAAEYLRLAGFEVVQSFDAEAALEILRADAAFDAIILDKRMPRLNGLEAARKIKADPRTAAIPLVLLSASIQRSGIEPSADIAAFIAKPFRPKDLVAALNGLIPR